jgi:hypothetical protein
MENNILTTDQWQFLADVKINDLKSAKTILLNKVTSDVKKTYSQTVDESTPHGRKFIDATIKAQYDTLLKNLNASLHSFASSVIKKNGRKEQE